MSSQPWNGERVVDCSGDGAELFGMMGALGESKVNRAVSMTRRLAGKYSRFSVTLSSIRARRGEYDEAQLQGGFHRAVACASRV